MTLTGTLAQINTTLSAAGNVVYNSDTGFIGTDTLTMTTNDGGNSGLGGPLSDVDLMSIEVRNSRQQERLQRRRQVGHPVAARQRPAGDLGTR